MNIQISMVIYILFYSFFGFIIGGASSKLVTKQKEEIIFPFKEKISFFENYIYKTLDKIHPGYSDNKFSNFYCIELVNNTEEVGFQNFFDVLAGTTSEHMYIGHFIIDWPSDKSISYTKIIKNCMKMLNNLIDLTMKKNNLKGNVESSKFTVYDNSENPYKYIYASVDNSDWNPDKSKILGNILNKSLSLASESSKKKRKAITFVTKELFSKLDILWFSKKIFEIIKSIDTNLTSPIFYLDRNINEQVNDIKFKRTINMSLTKTLLRFSYHKIVQSKNLTYKKLSLQHENHFIYEELILKCEKLMYEPSSDVNLAIFEPQSIIHFESMHPRLYNSNNSSPVEKDIFLNIIGLFYLEYNFKGIYFDKIKNTCGLDLKQNLFVISMEFAGQIKEFKPFNYFFIIDTTGKIVQSFRDDIGCIHLLENFSDVFTETDAKIANRFNELEFNYN
ncbi:hypothetical protein CWI38_0588p0010 [Hamiltosporidium tvaerminnensis]|uniref:Uncharacterized protein n=1 Tax=Hamiltosporidium tvaerminnensis TaxID=1176355 RepID=A0A4Q9LVZ9_9MICR|nr:hypothetical protein CWI38_0588p0010 [Hamiltosporidium tvaerminnensis]